MFEEFRLGCEGAYNFFINNMDHQAGEVAAYMDDRLLDAVHNIENNVKLEIKRTIYRLNREQNEQ
jgi:hypothetical protein